MLHNVIIDDIDLLLSISPVAVLELLARAAGTGVVAAHLRPVDNGLGALLLALWCRSGLTLCA